jgi:uncharacterized membrane protein required for colicin V production
MLLVVIALGIVNGVRRGLIYSLFGLVGLVVALAAGWSYAPSLAEYFEQTWGWQRRLAEYLARSVPFPQEVGGMLSPGADYSEFARMALTVLGFIVVFLAVTVAVRVLAHLLRAVLGGGFTGALDRLLGGLFGFFTTTISLSVLLGIMAMLSASMPSLHWAGLAVEESSLGRELARVFYLLSPLSERLLQLIT